MCARWPLVEAAVEVTTSEQQVTDTTTGHTVTDTPVELKGHGVLLAHVGLRRRAAPEALAAVCPAHRDSP